MTRRRAVGASALVHLVLLGAISSAWLFHVEAVTEPPLPIRFVPAPPRPLLEPFRLQDTAGENTEPAPPVEPPKPAPAKFAAAPPPPIPATEPIAAAVEPAFDAASAPPARASALDDLPSPLASGRAVRSSVTLTLGTVAAAPGIVVAGGNTVLAPEPGSGGRRRSGAPVSPPIATPPGVAALPPGTTAAGTAARQDAADREDGSPAAEAEAVRLGKRFSLQLMDARRLGRSTHDGWRYNQVLASLTEAYLGLAQRGRAAVIRVRDGDVDSVEVDPDAIAIAYHDGTRHVIAPTPDGLVVLYIAADPAARSKVDEAERALAALRRLARDGSRS